jgi:hypothetical protein
MRSLARPVASVTEERRPADEVDGDAIQVTRDPVIPGIVEAHARYGSQQVDAVWFVTELDHPAWKSQIGGR